MLELENMRNGLPMLDILGDSENTNKNKIFAIAPMMGWTDIDKEKAAECGFLLTRVGAMYQVRTSRHRCICSHSLAAAARLASR
jgi:hypothetical protein